MGAWIDAERIARTQFNLSDDYVLEIASVQVSDIDLAYKDKIFNQIEDDIRFGSSPEMIVELMEQCITYIQLPAGIFLVKMVADNQPGVWGFIQQQEQK